MQPSPTERAQHIKDRITRIRELLAGRTFESAEEDIAVWPAFERYLEIISEASRHLPEDWKTTYGAEIPWRQIADLGNLLRHVYHRIDAPVFWDIYRNDLASLEAAIDAMIAADGATGGG